MQHKVKCHVDGFESLITGARTHDIRVDDRGFKVGDTIFQEEYDPMSNIFTERSCLVVITCIIHDTSKFGFELPADVCVMSIRLLDVNQKE